MKTTITLVSLSLAVSIPSPAHAVTFDWAKIGNPGNAGDVQADGTFGAVPYIYRISKTEVTNGQYTEFLNAVAAADPKQLYSIQMELHDAGGILRSGESGSYHYTTKPGQENRPVDFVTFFDAMRFANWLDNGQPTGAQGPATTEDGVYAIVNGLVETRARSARYFLPSEDEWYKAAYHKNDGVTGNYWDYPTGTDTAPTAEPPPGGENSATFGKVNGWSTDVGAFTHSQSPYGTFDQGGNVFEWHEGLKDGRTRGLRGGWAGSGLDASNLNASSRRFISPAADGFGLGFRVAAIPEPSTLLLGAMAALGLLMSRGRESVHDPAVVGRYAKACHETAPECPLHRR